MDSIYTPETHGAAVGVQPPHRIHASSRAAINLSAELTTEEITSGESISFQYQKDLGPILGFQEQKTGTIYQRLLQNKHGHIFF